MEKYDDGSWHLEGDFPAGVAEDASLAHIGHFVAWIVRRGLESELLRADFCSEVEAVRAGACRGVDLVRAMDGKLTSDDLSDKGRQFASAVYDRYLEAFEAWCGQHGYPTMYHAGPVLAAESAAARILDRLYSESDGCR